MSIMDLYMLIALSITVFAFVGSLVSKKVSERIKGYALMILADAVAIGMCIVANYNPVFTIRVVILYIVALLTYLYGFALLRISQKKEN